MRIRAEHSIVDACRRVQDRYGFVQADTLAEEWNCSTRTASGYLRGLVSEGWLRRDTPTAYGSNVGPVRYKVIEDE